MAHSMARKYANEVVVTGAEDVQHHLGHHRIRKNNVHVVAPCAKMHPTQSWHGQQFLSKSEKRKENPCISIILYPGAWCGDLALSLPRKAVNRDQENLSGDEWQRCSKGIDRQSMGRSYDRRKKSYGGNKDGIKVIEIEKPTSAGDRLVRQLMLHLVVVRSED